MALTDWLKVYYKLDENTATTASNAVNPWTYDWTLSSSGLWDTGKINYCCQFPSSTNTIRFGINGQTGIMDNGWWWFSISMWLKKTSSFTQTYRQWCFFVWWWGNQWIYLAIDTSDPTHFYVSSDSGSSSEYSTGTFTHWWNTGEWHHLVFTRAWKTRNTYVDGNSTPVLTQNTATATYSWFSNSWDWFSIGNLRADWTAQWWGSIDEFGIWNRALSTAEIAQLYNSGAGLQYPFTATGNTSSMFQMF